MGFHYPPKLAFLAFLVVYCRGRLKQHLGAGDHYNSLLQHWHIFIFMLALFQGWFGRLFMDWAGAGIVPSLPPCFDLSLCLLSFGTPVMS